MNLQGLRQSQNIEQQEPQPTYEGWGEFMMPPDPMTFYWNQLLHQMGVKGAIQPPPVPGLIPSQERVNQLAYSNAWGNDPDLNHTAALQRNSAVGNSMGPDRTRPWGEFSSKGANFFPIPGDARKGADLSGPNGDWTSMASIPPLDPSWVQGSMAPQQSPMDMIRALFTRQ